MVAEAVRNMKQFFTVVGITEQLDETASVLGTVMPWLDKKFVDTDGYEEMECPLQHDNSSPKNNGCGDEKGKTHWALPDKPDAETRELILKHNAMDLQLYESAVEYFRLQSKAVDEVKKRKKEQQEQEAAEAAAAEAAAAAAA